MQLLAPIVSPVFVKTVDASWELAHVQKANKVQSNGLILLLVLDHQYFYPELGSAVILQRANFLEMLVLVLLIWR